MLFVDKRGLEVCRISIRPSLPVDIYNCMYSWYIWYCSPGEFVVQ